MATLKQARAIKNIVENRGNISRGMREAGYSLITAKNPKNLTQSKTWQAAVKEIDYIRHLNELDDMASIKNNPDKDNVLKAKKMVFDLGDKFPAQRSKVIGLFETVKGLEE